MLLLKEKKKSEETVAVCLFPERIREDSEYPVSVTLSPYCPCVSRSRDPVGPAAPSQTGV